MSTELRYLVDGERSKFTPSHSQLQHGAHIDVMLEQIGGNAEGDDENKASGEGEVTLRLRDQVGEEMFFKVKATTKMEKVLKSYSKRRGVSIDALRFMADGARVQPDDTPDTLGLEDDDQIDVVLMTIGGGGGGADAEKQEVGTDTAIVLHVRDQDGADVPFRVKKNTSLRKIFGAYAEAVGVNVQVLRFSVDGERLTGAETPKMVELEDNDRIDVLLDQTGGADAEGEAEKPADGPITIKVKDQGGQQLEFRVKRSTHMRKIFQAYAEQTGVAMDGLRFTLDGERVNDDDTPKMLDLDDGDQIDVVLHQVGGADVDDKAAVAADNQPITIIVKDQGGDKLEFRVKRDAAMRKIFNAYASQIGVSADVLRFTLDGDRVNDDDTPKMLELEDGDQIDVLLHQVGGNGTEADIAATATAADVDAPVSKSITIRICATDEDPEDAIGFKLKPDTSFAKMFSKYAEHRGVAVESFRYMFDGTHVGANHTPKMLEMEDGDLIYAMVEQLGGKPSHI